MKLKYHFEKMELDDEIVAVPTGDNTDGFYGVVKLNRSAADIFELLQNDTTEEEIINVLLKKFDISREELTAFVRGYISQLDAEGLIVNN